MRRLRITILSAVTATLSGVLEVVAP